MADFDRFARKWGTESFGFLTQKSQIIHQILFLLHFTHDEIYKYFSPEPDSSFCKFRGEKKKREYSLAGYKLLFSQQHKISHSSFILCCTSENM